MFAPRMGSPSRDCHRLRSSGAPSQAVAPITFPAVAHTYVPLPGVHRSMVSLTSGCQLFLRYVSRFVAESVGEKGFDESVKRQLLER